VTYSPIAKKLLKSMTPVRKDLTEVKIKLQYLIQAYSVKSSWDSGPLTCLVHMYSSSEQFLFLVSRLIDEIESAKTGEVNISEKDVQAYTTLMSVFAYDRKKLLSEHNISLASH